MVAIGTSQERVPGAGGRTNGGSEGARNVTGSRAAGALEARRGAAAKEVDEGSRDAILSPGEYMRVRETMVERGKREKGRDK